MDLPEPVADFTYFNGITTVHADRLATYRQILIRTRGKPNELADKVFAVRPDEPDVEKLMESWEAAEQLVALVRDVFGMAPFDAKTGQGAREEHCWTVWTAFCDSMDEAKKKPATEPTTSTPTDTRPATPPPGTNTSGSS